MRPFGGQFSQFGRGSIPQVRRSDSRVHHPHQAVQFAEDRAQAREWELAGSVHAHDFSQAAIGIGWDVEWRAAKQLEAARWGGQGKNGRKMRMGDQMARGVQQRRLKQEAKG